MVTSLSLYWLSPSVHETELSLFWFWEQGAYKDWKRRLNLAIFSMQCMLLEWHPLVGMYNYLYSCRKPQLQPQTTGFKSLCCEEKFSQMSFSFLASCFKVCICQMGAAMATALQMTVRDLLYCRNHDKGLYYINAKTYQALHKLSTHWDNDLIRQ